MNEFPFGSRGSRIGFHLLGPLAIVVAFPTFAKAGWNQAALFLLIPYVSLVLARFRPFPSLYGSSEGTELVLFLGNPRRMMERVYLGEVVLASLLHAAAFWLAWRISSFDGAATLGLREPLLALKVFSFLLSIQVLGRSFGLLIVNAPLATCLPRRLRGFWSGNADTAWFILVTAIGALVLLAIPPTLVGTLESLDALWIPAVAYLAALTLMVPTTEFGGDARSWRPQWVSRRSSPLPAASRYQPLVGLWWTGLSRWVWGTFALCVTPAALIAVLRIFWPATVDEDALMLPRAIWFGLAAWSFILLLFGGRALRWSAIGDSAAALYLAGLRPSTLRRVKLISSAVIVAFTAALVVLAALDLPDLGPFERGLFGSGESRLQFIVLAAASHLLLRTNDSFVFFRRGKNVRGSSLASPLAGVMFLTFGAYWVAEGLLGARGHQMIAPLVRAIGFALFAAAAVLWIAGWRRAHLEVDRRD